ncbi:MAG: hypothetical protein ACREFQ_20035, partial [Stellaceae bacterium]
RGPPVSAVHVFPRRQAGLPFSSRMRFCPVNINFQWLLWRSRYSVDLDDRFTITNPCLNDSFTMSCARHARRQLMARPLTLYLGNVHKEHPASQQRQGSRHAPSLLRRLFFRRQPTLYDRCLAVHMAGARATSALR